jgi:hypothetical protein
LFGLVSNGPISTL